MRIAVFTLTIFLQLCTSTYASQVKSIAVSDFVAHGISLDYAAIISDQIRTELLKDSTIHLMERSQMDQILKEQAFSQSGACDASECAVQIGKLLSVDELVVGSIGKIGDMYTITMRLLDVESGEIIRSKSENYSGRIEDFVTTTIPSVTASLIGGDLPRISRRITKSSYTNPYKNLFYASSSLLKRALIDYHLTPENGNATIINIGYAHQSKISSLSQVFVLPAIDFGIYEVFTPYSRLPNEYIGHFPLIIKPNISIRGDLGRVYGISGLALAIPVLQSINKTPNIDITGAQIQVNIGAGAYIFKHVALDARYIFSTIDFELLDPQDPEPDEADPVISHSLRNDFELRAIIAF